MTSVGWPEVYPASKTDPVESNMLDWIYKCSVLGCTWMTAHKTYDIAFKEKARHQAVSCPYEGGIGMAGKSILQKLWDEVDNVMVFLIDNKPDKGTPREGDAAIDFALAQGQAQGLAKAIFLMSQPHFADEAAVAKWAGRRYKMNAGIVEVLETPGLGAFVAPPTTAPKPRGVVTVPDISDVTGEKLLIIKNGLSAMLPVASIAKLVGLTEGQVNAVKRNIEASAT